MRVSKDALSIYKDRLSNRHYSLQKLLRRTRLVGYLRGVAGLLIPVTLWLAVVPHLVSIWLTLIPVSVFFALHKYYEETYRKLSCGNRSIEFYERCIDRIENRWMGTGITDTTLADTTHLYANDLDIFGKGSLFELLCTARTRSGQQTLARWLCSPTSRTEILRRQEAIDELRNNVDLREELSTFGPNRASINFDLAAEWAFRPSVLNSTTARVVAPLIVAFTMSAIGCSYWLHGNPIWMIFAAAVQIGFALVYRKRAADVVSSIHEPAGELELLQAPLARLERVVFSSSKLRELKTTLQTDGQIASRQVGTLVGLNQMLEYRFNSSVGPFLPVLLWSTQVAFAIEAWRGRNGRDLQSWMAVVGEFEAICALAGFAFENSEYPFAEILEGPACVDGRSLRHPLLPQSQCVPNSISLGPELQLLMVSGSNMSGKSTLLRTVGINLVLGLAGAPVCGQQLKCSPLHVGATLRVQDSLQSGKSRFYARDSATEGDDDHGGRRSADLIPTGRDPAWNQFSRPCHRSGSRYSRTR
jgi:hypothetical protein